MKANIQLWSWLKDLSVNYHIHTRRQTDKKPAMQTDRTEGTNAGKHASVHANVHTYIHTYIHPSIHTYTHTYVHTRPACDRQTFRQTCHVHMLHTDYCARGCYHAFS